MSITLEFKWGVSRGRDSYGYNICSLYVNGDKVSSCNGGGYDMKGTALGNWVAKAFAKRLTRIPKRKFPEQREWIPDPDGMMCNNIDCLWPREKRDEKSIIFYRGPAKTCPQCGNPTVQDHRAGHYEPRPPCFYGLTFHDPNFDPGKAKLRHQTAFAKAAQVAGMTVEEAEAKGLSLGLERYQAFYAASSTVPTRKHRIPLINGACGFSSVEKIMAAIGLSLEYVPTKGRNSVYILHDRRNK